MMGFDFGKLQWEGSEEHKTVKLKSVPQPRIISINPEITYYNLENGLFNKFKNEDLNKIQAHCIEHITKTALDSNLPNLAAEQAKLLIGEMAQMHQWKIEGLELILNDLVKQIKT